MDPTRLERIKEALLLLSELPGAERAEWMDRHLSGDASLRREVESLLASSHGPDGALTPPLLAGAGPDPARRIGPYTVEGVLGQGAMGVVYRARQTSPVERLVAVKVVDPAVATPELLSRFRAEQRAVAALEHPNIARLLDAGTASGSCPYVAMELVQGPPITEHCRTQRLPIRAIVGLAVQVARALHHAHLRGVLHRDIKPSNILVATTDAGPVAKLIDFGVARLTRENEQGERRTLAGQIIGTVEYMSPEQADPVRPDADARSDVYSLGVVVYEMLTGLLPHEPAAYRRDGLAGGLRLVREGSIPRPSARAQSQGGSRLPIPGDLDCIVLKALQKAPEQRFESAREFADDLQRFLDGLPIAARPPTTLTRVASFVRRNRLPVAAAAAVFATLLAGAVGTGIGLIRAERRGAALEAALRESDAVGGYLRGLLTGSLVRNLGPEATLRELVTRTAADALANPDPDPVIRARVTEALSLALLDLGENAQAEALLRAAIDAMPDPANVMHAEVLVQALIRLAIVRIDEGDAGEAERLLTRAAGLGERFPAMRGSLLAESRANLAATVDELGDSGRAAIILRAHLAERTAAGAGEDELESVRMNLAITLSRCGDWAGAAEMSRGALERRRRTLPVNEHMRITAARVHGESLSRLGRHEEAIAVLEQHVVSEGSEVRSPAQMALRLTLLRARLAAGDASAPGELAALASVAEGMGMPDRIARFFRASAIAGSIAAGEADGAERAGAFMERMAADYGAEHPDLARAHTLFARALRDAGLPAEARPHALAARDAIARVQTVRTPLQDELDAMVAGDPAAPVESTP